MYTLLRRCPAPGDDRGFTLLVAIAVAAVGIALAGAVVGLAITTGNASGVDRQHTVAISAAESGIDSILARMGEGVTGQEAMTFPCGGTQTVWSHLDKVSVVATVTYTLTTNVPVTGCLTNNQTPKSAEITAVATLTRAVGTAAAESRTMKATVTITPPTSSTTAPPTLNHAVFGNASVSLNNSFTMKASTNGAKADVYSNGPVACTNTNTIEGSVTSQGGISFDNTCTVQGNVWAATTISTLNTLSINGDAIAAGSSGTTISTGNSGLIKGHALSNGDIIVSDSSSIIEGSAVSTGGKIALLNSGRILGSAYAKTNVEVGNSATISRDAYAVTGTISGVNASKVLGAAWGRCVGPKPPLTVTGVSTPPQGSACGANPILPPTVNPPGSPARAIPATILPPPPQPFPTINSDAQSIQAWSDAGWALKNFKSPTLSGDRCALARTYLSDIASGTQTWAGKLLVVVPTCTTSVGLGLTWVNAGSITLKHDLAIMSDENFSTGNAFTVKSSSSSPHNLYWIVPSDSPRVTSGCTSTESGSIRHPNAMTVTNVAWMMFTPCTVDFGNAFGTSGSPVKGQIYAGTVDIGNGIHVQMQGMQVPGATGGGLTPGAPVANPNATYSIVANNKSER